MRGKLNPSESWLWYSACTEEPVAMDLRAYPPTLFDGETYPWPEWACRSPEGCIHQDARVGTIDVCITSPPNPAEEIGWTSHFGVSLVAHSWLDQVADLVEPSGVCLGKLYLDGRVVEGWSTVHQPFAPTIWVDDGARHSCSRCGYVMTVIYRGPHFVDPAARDRRFIVNTSGIFIRADEARRRGLRKPVGAFYPGLVRLRLPSP